MKGCLTRFKVTAPTGTNRMTPADFASKQDRDPLAEGSRLGPRAAEEVDGLGRSSECRDTPDTNERPTRPETRPPKKTARHRTTTRQQATARQQVAAEASTLHANALPKRQDRLQPLMKAMTRFREGPRTSQQSERSERSARHERPPRPNHGTPDQVQQLKQGRQAVAKPTAAIRTASAPSASAVPNGRHASTSKTDLGYRGPERSHRSISLNNHLKNGTPSHPRRLIQSPSLSICRPPSLAASTQWLDMNRQYEDNAGGQRVHAHQNAPNHPRRLIQSPTLCTQLATSLAAPTGWNQEIMDSTGRAAGTQCFDRNQEYEDNAGGQRVHAHQNAPNHPRRFFQSPTLCVHLATSLAARTDRNQQDMDSTGRQRVRAPPKLGFYHPIFSIKVFLSEVTARVCKDEKIRFPSPYFEQASKPASKIQQKQGCRRKKGA